MLGSPPASSSSKSGGFILLVVLSILAVSGVFYRKEEDIHVNVDKCISLPLLFYSSMFHLNFKKFSFMHGERLSFVLFVATNSRSFHLHVHISVTDHREVFFIAMGVTFNTKSMLHLL